MPRKLQLCFCPEALVSSGAADKRNDAIPKPWLSMPAFAALIAQGDSPALDSYWRKVNNVASIRHGDIRSLRRRNNARSSLNNPSALAVSRIVGY